MRGRQVLWQVEVPYALPLFLSGLRSALLQVIATATIAAIVGLDGLGRFIIDGLAVSDYAQSRRVARSRRPARRSRSRCCSPLLQRRVVSPGPAPGALSVGSRKR